MEKQSDNCEVKYQQLAAKCQQLQEQNKDLITLNRELNHRLKNSLVAIKADIQKLKPNAQAEMQLELGSIISRIESVYLLTTQLQYSGNNDQVNLQTYLHTLLHNIGVQLNYPEAHFRVDLDIPADYGISMWRANRIGTILVELAFNAAKHANRIDKKLQIAGRLAEGIIKLEIEDNGPAISPASETGLGLTLIKDIVSYQLKGCLELSTPHRWLLTIPLDIIL